MGCGVVAHAPKNTGKQMAATHHDLGLLSFKFIRNLLIDGGLMRGDDRDLLSLPGHDLGLRCFFGIPLGRDVLFAIAVAAASHLQKPPTRAQHCR